MSINRNDISSKSANVDILVECPKNLAKKSMIKQRATTMTTKTKTTTTTIYNKSTNDATSTVLVDYYIKEQWSRFISSRIILRKQIQVSLTFILLN